MEKLSKSIFCVYKGDFLVNSGRVLAFDFGVNHIGVACGNENTFTAEALQALKANNGIPNEQELDVLFAKWSPDYIVVGLPVNMDGSSQEMTNRARKFGRRLMSRFILPVYFKDERLSSADAKDEIFRYQGGYRSLAKNKGRIDATAARIILEGFFDLGGRSGNFVCEEPKFAQKKK